MSILAPLKTAIKKLPILSELVAERDTLRAERNELRWKLAAIRRNLYVSPGHYYSPIPSLDEITKDESQIFGNIPGSILGVDLHEQEQLKLLNEFATYYEDMPFTAGKREGLRYYYENPAYSYADAICLHCMIRHLKPKQIIEVGSGFSSCMMLDTNELFFDSSIATTFVDPHPELLISLINDSDREKIKIIPSRLQDVDLASFEALHANDILFIDSTHVSKINSDVNRIFFDILPRLSSGVYVHFHDIFFPFEYPKEWVYEGRAWNEAYLLRAFLQYNNLFSVVLMNTFMERFHRSFLEQRMPLYLKDTGGCMWIRKT